MIAQPTNRHLIVAVHGIRTRGLWSDELRRLVQEKESEVVVLPYRYGYLSAIGFLLPPIRWLMARRFRVALAKKLAAERWRRVDIVAHSFGCYMATNALRWLAQEKPAEQIVNTVILAGAALSDRFPVSDIVPKIARRLINDCSTLDGPLILSQIVGPGMAGRIGLRGFQDPESAINRYFLLGHSDFFIERPDGRSHMAEEWVRFLVTDDPIPWPHDPRPPLTALSGAAAFVLANIPLVRLPLATVLLSAAALYIGSFVAESRRASAAAESRRIAAMAEIVIESDPAKALAVGLQAVTLSPTAEAERVLLKAVRRSHLKATLANEKGTIKEAYYSPDGAYIATVGADSVRVWNATDLGIVADLKHAGAVRVRFYEGNKLASFATDGSVKLWGIGRKMPLAQLATQPVNDAVLFDHGRQLITGGDSGVRVWSTESGKPSAIIQDETESSIGKVAINQLFASFLPPPSLRRVDDSRGQW